MTTAPRPLTAEEASGLARHILAALHQLGGDCSRLEIEETPLGLSLRAVLFGHLVSTLIVYGEVPYLTVAAELLASAKALHEADLAQTPTPTLVSPDAGVSETPIPARIVSYAH